MRRTVFLAKRFILCFEKKFLKALLTETCLT
jgi:hypothetical protein